LLLLLLLLPVVVARLASELALFPADIAADIAVVDLFARVPGIGDTREPEGDNQNVNGYESAATSGPQGNR
jgi:hypothetical protein